MTFVRTKTIRGRKYQYLVKSEWDPEKKQPRQRVVRYLGPVDESGGKPVLRPAPVRVTGVDAVKPIGRLATYYAAARDIDLLGLAEDLLGDREHATRLLALALNQLVHRRSLTKAVEWINASPLAAWLDTGPLAREDLEATLSQVCHVEDGVKRDAGAALQRALTLAWRQRYKKEPAEAYYDVTKVTYFGDHCDLAQRGYTLDRRKKRTIGVGLVTSRGSAFPILCRSIPGNRNDGVTMPDVVHALSAQGLENLTLVVDRGILHKENIRLARKHEFHVLGGCPSTSDEVQRSMRRFTDAQLEESKNAIRRSRDHVAYAKGWNGSLFGVQGRLVLVLDSVRRSVERTERDSMLTELETTTDPKRLTELRAALGGLVKTSKGRRGFTVDSEAVERARGADGRFLLFTTRRDLSDKDSFRIYFQKDEVEKAFRTLKGDVTLGPLRFRRPERIDAYLTAVFVAYLLRSVVAFKLREAGSGLSVDEALDLMESWSEVQFTSGNQAVRWRTKPTKAQEDLIKLFELDRVLPSA